MHMVTGRDAMAAHSRDIYLFLAIRVYVHYSSNII